jgi:tripartite-type tricarboxylate transporter receptor subunit TctC
MIARRTLLATLALPALARAQARAQGGAQGWAPSHSIRLLVPYGPGGGADTTARLLAGPMGAVLGQTVVVENRQGAGASIGAAEVARSAPDGHTLMMDAMAHLVTPAMMRLPLDYATAFAPLSLVTELPHILLVPNTSPAQDLAGLLAELRARPGEVAFGTSGNGTAGHLASVILARRAQLQVLNAPYRGIGPALQDLIAGRLGFVFATVASAMPLVRAGTARAIAVSSLDRIPAAAEIRTVAEQGFPGFEMNEWNGLFLPAGTPAPALAALSAAVQHAVGDATVKARIAAMGAVLVGSTAESFGAYLAARRPVIADLVRAEGITPE